MGGGHSRHAHNAGRAAGDITEVANFDFRDDDNKGEEEEEGTVKLEEVETDRLREGVGVTMREGLDLGNFERREANNLKGKKAKILANISKIHKVFYKKILFSWPR